MNKLFNKSNRIFLLALAVFLIILASGMALIPSGQAGMVLFLLTVLVGFLGIVGGPIIALGLTLLLYFFIGSIFFWFIFTGVALVENEIPFAYLLIWMVALLILSVTTGRFSMHIKGLYNENRELREEIRTLVAVDPVTGFDNKERMLLELELESNRSKRYGHTFSFLILKMDYFEEFRKLYGEVELTNMLLHISKGIYRSTRISDHKFRVEKDTFALLLTDTPITDIEIVIHKLAKELKVFQLQNKKYITLTFKYGYAGFDEELQNHTDIYKQAKEQVFELVS